MSIREPGWGSVPYSSFMRGLCDDYSTSDLRMLEAGIAMQHYRLTLSSTSLCQAEDTLKLMFNLMSVNGRQIQR